MNHNNKIKTLKGWEKLQGNQDLDAYLQPLDEIDEELYWYIVCAYMPPTYQHAGLIQGGDACDKVNGAYTYMTVNEINGRYYYLGILPEFKTNDNDPF